MRSEAEELSVPRGQYLLKILRSLREEWKTIFRGERMGADQGAMEKDRMGVEVQLPTSNVLIATKGLHPIPNANRAARGAISLLGKKGEANIDTVANGTSGLNHLYRNSWR